jgi:nucleotide-binding universal stress UspA family protein
MKNKIIVPVDFEQQSIKNLDWAKHFARINNSQIVVTHIIENTGFFKKIFNDNDLENKIISEAKENLKKVVAEHIPEEITSHTSVEKGKPYEVIEDLADEFEPLMIILGRNENPEKNKKYLGSNTLHIINETDYPVVTTFGSQSPENSKNTILLPLDLTKSIEEQITVAYEFANILKANIKAITIDRIDSVAHDAQMLVKLNQLKEYFEKQNIKIETQIIDDKETNPAEIINKIADELKPVLTIIMLREESNFKNFFIGSVARDIIENCNAPVLSVKPWNRNEEENPVFKTIVNPFNIL